MLRKRKEPKKRNPLQPETILHRGKITWRKDAYGNLMGFQFVKTQLVEKKQRKPMRRVSKRRAEQLRTYAERRKAFLEAHPICQVWLKENGFEEKKAFRFGRYKGIQWDDNTEITFAALVAMGAPQSTEVHHQGKRRNEALLDESKWLAVCRENHERIERDKAWARVNGFLENF